MIDKDLLESTTTGLAGDLLFRTDLNAFRFYNGISWSALSDSFIEGPGTNGFIACMDLKRMAEIQCGHPNPNPMIPDKSLD